MDWGLLATFGVGAWGAGLSTYSALARRREKKRRVNVRLTTGIIALASRKSEPMFLIKASNPGEREVSLTGVGVQYPDGTKSYLSQPRTPMPYALGEGQSCTNWIPTATIRSGLIKQGIVGRVRLRGFYDGAIGTQYVSKPIDFDVA